MTGAERGFLLLTAHLGNPARKPLTVAQFRELSECVKRMPLREIDRELRADDFLSVGYSQTFARHLVDLLQEEQLLEYYLLQAKKADCHPITRATDGYPTEVRHRLGMDSPGTLWAKGDISFLQMPKISLVGSRDLQSDNAAFAREVGRQAALQGFVLVSGNARGADQLAQNACLKAGGRVISVVADSLAGHNIRENLLYLSENGFDEPFSPQRALSRNRVIHALGSPVFVAQARPWQGGTWDGTEKNLRFGWSPVCCYDDGSTAQQLLADMGAEAVTIQDLRDLASLRRSEKSLFDQ